MSSGTSGLTDSLAQDISQEELDFSDLFLYNAAEEAFTADTADPGLNLHNDSHPPSLVVHQPVADLGADHAASNQGFRSANIGIIPAPSPRIEITPSGDSVILQPLEPSPRSQALGRYREQPCASPASSNSSTGWPADGYSPLVSPCVSPSGGGCAAGLSALDLCPGLQGVNSSSAQSSPGASPRTSITDETYLVPQQQRTNSPLHYQRSRSASPQGKRTYDQYCSPALGATPVKQRSRSPSPSTHEQQGTYYLHNHHQGQAEPPPPQARASSPSLEAMLRNLSSSPARVAPSNMGQDGDEGYACGQRQDYVYGDGQDWAVEQDRRRRAEDDVKPEAIYILPSMWSPYTAPYRTISGFPTAPLSSLDWPLPSQSGPYELVIHQQPRSHHRAHYETEGSRGAVKTPSGGHPVVQLHGYQGSAPLGLQVFIGTADERVLKPHAFYQVHRITGKTVTTPSLERMVNGTKFLEIPLEPKAHMKAVIDCAGILKLRNADIELRNGETDVGRKNTRVRLVFRVHIPQQDGQFVSLQAASHPIECSQRSAQELPAVERQNLDRCSVLGGQQMVLTGQNFTSESKVIFSEKTQDGQKLWEVEATVDRDKTQSNMLFVEVPPYRDPAIYHPAKVNFYVINGKKKRSQPQHFIYTPMIAIKAEPIDDYQFSLYSSAESHALSMSPKSFYHPSQRDSFSKAVNISPTSYLLSNQDQESRGLTQQFLEDTPVYYPSRASPLNNSPVLYYGANQQSNLGTSPLRGFPVQKLNTRLQQCHYPAMVSCLSTTPLTSQCVGTEFPVADLEQGGDVYPSMAALSQGDSLFETPSLARYVQTISPLGKMVSSRYIQDPAPEKRGTRVEPAGPLQTLKDPGSGVLCDRVPEKVTVKQENLNHAYLEDVNDIIKRDLRCHHGECS